MTITPHQTLTLLENHLTDHHGMTGGEVCRYLMSLGIHPEAEAAPAELFTIALDPDRRTTAPEWLFNEFERNFTRAEKAEAHVRALEEQLTAEQESATEILNRKEQERSDLTARIRELEAQVRKPVPGIVQTFESMKARLRAIDKAREGEPSMPGLPDKASINDLIVHLNILKAHDRAGWDAAASLRVELAQAKEANATLTRERDEAQSALAKEKDRHQRVWESGQDSLFKIESLKADLAAAQKDAQAADNARVEMAQHLATAIKERDEARAAQRSAERGEQIAQAELAHDRAKFNVMLEDAKIQERQRFAPLVESARLADTHGCNQDAWGDLRKALSDLEGGE